LFYPAEVDCNLFFLAFPADLFPKLYEIWVGLFASLLVFDLFVGLPDLVFHVREFNEGVGLGGFVGGDLDESMKDAGHSNSNRYIIKSN
jgi:hypothetical protein